MTPRAARMSNPRLAWRCRPRCYLRDPATAGDTGEVASQGTPPGAREEDLSSAVDAAVSRRAQRREDGRGAAGARLPRIATTTQALSQVTLGFHGRSNPLGLGAQIHACRVHTLTAVTSAAKRFAPSRGSSGKVAANQLLRPRFALARTLMGPLRRPHDAEPLARGPRRLERVFGDLKHNSALRPRVRGAAQVQLRSAPLTRFHPLSSRFQTAPVAGHRLQTGAGTAAGLAGVSGSSGARRFRRRNGCSMKRYESAATGTAIGSPSRQPRTATSGQCQT
jgi:hypothetical protein